jgi:hypothetical protein
MAISAAGTVMALVFSLLGFLLSPTLQVFAPLLTLALLGLFITTSPLCALPLSSLCCHAFGNMASGSMHGWHGLACMAAGIKHPRRMTCPRPSLTCSCLQ